MIPVTLALAGTRPQPRSMRFPQALIPATLLRRYQRFLADVRLADGSVVTAYCPNTGRMLGYAQPGSRIWLSPRRSGRLAYTWELTETPDALVLAHPHHANALVREALRRNAVAPLSGYQSVRAEVRYGVENSRVDLLLQSPGRPDCFVEIKSVTAIDEFGIALFPDAVSQRAARHMRELSRQVARGARAIVLFCVQREDALALRAGGEIDPVYAQALRDAARDGVELLAWRCRVSCAGLALQRRIPILR
ncbi:MAG: DNA/RNA nuclease SfsA [Tahibacter sp.]